MVEAAINLGFIDDPGTAFDSCTANTQILSGVLTKLTGEWLIDFAQDNLFTPLGIPDSHWSWAMDDHNYALGGYGMNLRPRDMARFGYLYLNQGYWDGKQVVSANWVQDRLVRRLKQVMVLNMATCGGSPPAPICPLTKPRALVGKA